MRHGFRFHDGDLPASLAGSQTSWHRGRRCSGRGVTNTGVARAANAMILVALVLDISDFPRERAALAARSLRLPSLEPSSISSSSHDSKVWASTLSIAPRGRRSHSITGTHRDSGSNHGLETQALGVSRWMRHSGERATPGDAAPSRLRVYRSPRRRFSRARSEAAAAIGSQGTCAAFACRP